MYFAPATAPKSNHCRKTGVLWFNVSYRLSYISAGTLVQAFGFVLRAHRFH
jgi:hypothetical protein